METRASARTIVRVIVLLLVAAVCGTASFAVGQAASPVPRTEQAKSNASRLVPSVKSLGPGDREIAQAYVPKHSECFLVARHAKQHHHDAKRIRGGKVRVSTGVAQFTWRTRRAAWSGRWHLSLHCRGRKSGDPVRTVATSRVLVGSGKGGTGTHRALIARRIRSNVVHGSISGPGIGSGATCDPLGTHEIEAANWLQSLGGGVTVYSNGPACSYMDPYTHPYQCVDLVNRLLVAKGWSTGISGNATNFWENASGADFVQHPHDSGYVPVPGDIVVWGGTGDEGKYGHVQVVDSVTGSTLHVVQQNTSRGSRMDITMTSSGGIASRSWTDSSGYNTQYLKGFLHAKRNVGPSAAQAYNGHIVQWDGDSNVQKTAWWVSGGLRYWIPTSAIYFCLKGRGAPGPDVLTATVLDSLPDQTGQWVSCDSSGVGIGSGPPPTDPSGGPTPPPPTTPPPPPTYSETAGSVAHTWTNYTNAGGTQGPTISAYQTVQIACKLAGFKVADGNTWWYRIAQSPWNGAYYVSADAFYNNGATSGSLAGTPFVDPNVPNC
jgi:hypothetical protein